jgi:hypothetical protein
MHVDLEPSSSRPNPGWFRHVVIWDGLMNVSVVLIPFLVEAVFPLNPNILAFSCAVVPVAFLFLRFFLGLPWWSGRRLSPDWITCQKWLFGTTIISWLFFESFVMSLHFAPDSTPLILGCLAIGCPVYFCAMGLAMYPGADPVTTDDDSSFVHDVQ